jgi:hypothetical protein
MKARGVSRWLRYKSTNKLLLRYKLLLWVPESHWPITSNQELLTGRIRLVKQIAGATKTQEVVHA